MGPRRARLRPQRVELRMMSPSRELREDGVLPIDDTVAVGEALSMLRGGLWFPLRCVVMDEAALLSFWKTMPST